MKNLKLLQQLKPFENVVLSGRVKKIIGLTIEADNPLLSIGTRCEIVGSNNKRILSEIVGFKDDRIILMPYGNIDGINPGSIVKNISKGNVVKVSENLLGRILDGLGNPIDGKGSLSDFVYSPVYNDAPEALEREIIKTVLPVGISAIDALITLGRGQRTGIFAGSGIGKSVLLGMIARNTEADVNVIALIGERGREVKEFIENDLGEEGLKRSVVIVATSDQPALIRKLGAFVAMTVAEYFRKLGKHVLFMMDSITRFAMAQREIGLAVGEPPTTKGYTPSVFGLLPKLMERAGTKRGEGSITGLFSVLVEGDDLNDPIADAVRSIIDGHIVLNRDLAARNHYPAIDVMMSTSRLMKEIVTPKENDAAGKFRDLLSAYNEGEDLINIGAYKKGSNKRIDEAVDKIDKINKFLRQGIDKKVNFTTSFNNLKKVIS